MSSAVHDDHKDITEETPYQLFGSLTSEEYDALKDDIRQRGVLVPVELDENGHILDGHHRVKAWKELRAEGVEIAPYPSVVRYGLTEAEKRNHVRALNILRRHLSKEQRASIFADMRSDGMTLQQIADRAGVSVGTVHGDLKSSFSILKNSPDTVTGKDGKQYPASKSRAPKAQTPGLFTTDASEAQKAIAKAPERVRAVAARMGIHDPEKLDLLTHLYNSSGRPDTNGTFDEIEATGGFHYGPDFELWCNFGQARVVEIKQALKSVAEAHKQLKGDEKLQARVESVKDIAPAFDDYRHGDCLQLLPSLPPRSVRLLLTDPPYGIDFQSNRRTASAQAPKLTNDETPEKAIALFRAMLSSVSPAMADECHALIFTSWRYEPQFRTALEEAGFEIAASIVWVKENHGSGDLSGFAPKHERILHARRGGAAIRPRLDDVLIVPRERATDHPTEKPTALLEQLIACTTLEGELVVDPFAGAGSTVVAARRLGRKVFAVELDARWHAAGIERLVKEGFHAIA